MHGRLQGWMLELFGASPLRCQTDDEEAEADEVVRHERVSPSTRKHTVEQSSAHTCTLLHRLLGITLELRGRMYPFHVCLCEQRRCEESDF